MSDTGFVLLSRSSPLALSFLHVGSGIVGVALSVAGKIVDLEDAGNLWQEREQARDSLESMFCWGR